MAWEVCRKHFVENIKMRENFTEMKGFRRFMSLKLILTCQKVVNTIISCLQSKSICRDMSPSRALTQGRLKFNWLWDAVKSLSRFTWYFCMSQSFSLICDFSLFCISFSYFYVGPTTYTLNANFALTFWKKELNITKFAAVAAHHNIFWTHSPTLCGGMIYLIINVKRQIFSNESRKYIFFVFLSNLTKSMVQKLVKN